MMRFKTLYEKYERPVSSAAFIAGFVWDALTFTRIDLWLDNLILLAYLVVSGAGIILLNAYWSGSRHYRFLDPYASFLPLPIQFAFGGLFSGFFIFYSRSGSLAGSWPFLLFLAFLLVGNEFFRRRYFRLTFQMGVFFVALFSYAAFAVPVVWGKMGADVFLISGLAALSAVLAVIRILARVSAARFHHSQKTLFGTMGAIYLMFNLLFFTNLIPPIPLSLKEIVVAHSALRLNGAYEIGFEPAPRRLFFQEYSRLFHRVGSEPVYVYSAVFAPTALETKILHRWQAWDDKTSAWRETDRIAFQIVGGRDGGYRGFSFKENLAPGKWRVDVITERGQLIGRTMFRVVETGSSPEVKTVIR